MAVSHSGWNMSSLIRLHGTAQLLFETSSMKTGSEKSAYPVTRKSVC